MAASSALLGSACPWDVRRASSTFISAPAPASRGRFAEPARSGLLHTGRRPSNSVPGRENWSCRLCTFSVAEATNVVVAVADPAVAERARGVVGSAEEGALPSDGRQENTFRYEQRNGEGSDTAGAVLQVEGLRPGLDPRRGLAFNARRARGHRGGEWVRQVHTPACNRGRFRNTVRVYQGGTRSPTAVSKEERQPPVVVGGPNESEAPVSK